jgi:predicted  nucleic acid-binding Zn-ribbon protein
MKKIEYIVMLKQAIEVQNALHNENEKLKKENENLSYQMSRKDYHWNAQEKQIYELNKKVKDLQYQLYEQREAS